MPEHHALPFDLNEEVWTFLRARKGFNVNEVGRASTPTTSDRQQAFERELNRIAEHRGSRIVPVFLSTPSKGNVRLDQGCIGHAVANIFLEPLVNSEAGIIEWVTIRET